MIYQSVMSGALSRKATFGGTRGSHWGGEGRKGIGGQGGYLMGWGWGIGGPITLHCGVIRLCFGYLSPHTKQRYVGTKKLDF